MSVYVYMYMYCYTQKGFICNKEYYKTKGVSLFNDTGGVRYSIKSDSLSVTCGRL